MAAGAGRATGAGLLCATTGFFLTGRRGAPAGLKSTNTGFGASRGSGGRANGSMEAAAVATWIGTVSGMKSGRLNVTDISLAGTLSEQGVVHVRPSGTWTSAPAGDDSNRSATEPAASIFGNNDDVLVPAQAARVRPLAAMTRTRFMVAPVRSCSRPPRLVVKRRQSEPATRPRDASRQ